MEEGETKEETLAREVMEETGCEIKWFKQFREFEYQMDDTLVKATYYFGEVEGEIILSEEHSEFDWFSFEEIKSLDIAFNQKEVLIEFEKFYKSSN